MTDDQLHVRILGTGTSQGVPVIGCTCEVCTSGDPRDRRTRCSVLVRSGVTTLLIDIGPDFRQQMLDSGHDDVTAVLFTHEHNDHIAGLDDIRPINFRHRKNITCFGLRRTLKAVATRFNYVFDPANDYPGKPRLDLQEINGAENHKIGDIAFRTINVMHGSMLILGFRFGGFAYLTDVKTLDPREMEQLKDLDVLVVSALHHRPHHSHMNLEESLKLIEELKPRQTWLTHLSHYMGKAADVEPQLPANVGIAYDGLEICVDRD